MLIVLSLHHSIHVEHIFYGSDCITNTVNIILVDTNYTEFVKFFGIKVLKKAPSILPYAFKVYYNAIILNRLPPIDNIFYKFHSYVVALQALSSKQPIIVIPLYSGLLDNSLIYMNFFKL